MSNTNKQVEMLAGADRHSDTSLKFCGFSYFAKVLSLTGTQKRADGLRDTCCTCLKTSQL